MTNVYRIKKKDAYKNSNELLCPNEKPIYRLIKLEFQQNCSNMLAKPNESRHVRVVTNPKMLDYLNTSNQKFLSDKRDVHAWFILATELSLKH